MLKRLAINDGWKFNQEEQEVRLPHTCREMEYNYGDEEAYQMQCVYRRSLHELKNMKKELEIEGVQRPRFFLRFEGAAHQAEIFINESSVLLHHGGYTPFRVEITDAIHNEENQLRIELDTRESLNQPPFGNVIDYMTYGGLYREVYLEAMGENGFTRAYVHGEDAMEERQRIIMEFQFLSGRQSEYSVEYLLMDGEKMLLQGKRDLDESRDEAHEVKIYRWEEAISGLRLWDVEDPYCYRMVLRLWEKETGLLMDEVQIDFGIREAIFKKDGFYLNGRKLLLRGLNRHQSYPYVGYAMPKRAQERDAKIIKNELGLNAVRTAHYPQSRHFLEACDKLGLLVFTEIPGWQHIGDEEWKKIALLHVEEMVIEYRNHPSIILWGVRINESQDDDRFYAMTNKIAHELDPYRSTGGVRFLKKSSFLEDVYTYNDFVHNGTNQGIDLKSKVSSDPERPYLVSEYNGHMYPTKAFDDERHRLEHALRHARVLSDINKTSGVAGGFGWCMSDYNTHKDFGSGDRICYHGVLDMFRNKKTAAYVYESQGNHPVLHISSSMSIGDHPGGYIGPIYAFTNVDCVRLYKNDLFVKEFYANKKDYPGLIHPPICIDDFIGELLVSQEGYPPKKAERIKKTLYAIAKYGQNGLPLREKLKVAWLVVTRQMNVKEGTRLFYRYVGNWGDQVTAYRFEGIKQGKVVCEVRKQPGKRVILQLQADTRQLWEGDSYDVASVQIEAKDEYGNRLVYAMEPIQLQVSEGLEIIGPDVISLKGGVGGTYVRTCKKAGKGYLTAKGFSQSVSVEFDIQ